MALSGFISKEDFINQQQIFEASLAKALGMNVSTAGIFVIKVCYGRCRNFDAVTV